METVKKRERKEKSLTHTSPLSILRVKESLWSREEEREEAVDVKRAERAEASLRHTHTPFKVKEKKRQWS